MSAAELCPRCASNVRWYESGGYQALASQCREYCALGHHPDLATVTPVLLTVSQIEFLSLSTGDQEVACAAAVALDPLADMTSRAMATKILANEWNARDHEAG